MNYSIELTPEEMQMVQQAQQQPQEPSAEMVQAQGVLLTGQADLQKANNDQLRIQVDAKKVEVDGQLAAAKIAEIFNGMDLDKQKEFREMLKTMGSFQQQNSENARANAELLLKGEGQRHSQGMDVVNLLQSQRQNLPSGGAAEIPQ